MNSPSRFPLILRLVLAASLILNFRAGAQIDFAPPNDLFANRSDLGSVETATVQQKVFRASTEFGDPVTDSVWWQWTAPRDGWWEIQVPHLPEGTPAGGPVQVFEGENLYFLLLVPDGSPQLPPVETQRRLFQAHAGRKYQIAVSCDLASNGFDAPDASFFLRPAELPENTTSEARKILSEQAPGIWTGKGWTSQTTDTAFALSTEDDPIHSPLYWEWTCQVSGEYSFGLTPDSTLTHPLISAFRGLTPSVSARWASPHAATAGQKFLFVTGNRYPTAPHQIFQEVRLTSAEAPPNLTETNSSSPFTLSGPLPLTVKPPANAPKASQLFWNWHCPVNGWIAFEGPGLHPLLEAWSAGSETPEMVERDGKIYFWCTIGSYRLAVDGWQWPEGGSFTLKDAGLPPPSNDSFSHPEVLAGGNAATTTGSFLGSTRQLGDPPGTLSSGPRPTLWYEWQPAFGVRRAEVFFPIYQPQSGTQVRLNVFTGTDPAFLTEVPVSEPLEGDAFTPIHWEFPAGNQNKYYLCFSGFMDQFDLKIRGLDTGFIYSSAEVTELIGREVAEASTFRYPPDNYPGGDLWFKWRAPAAGWISWTTTAHLNRISRGGNFSVQYLLDLPAPETPLPVTAGETYWFQCGPEPANSDQTQTFRLSFSEFRTPIPGDNPETAISLGSQLPVSTLGLMIGATVSAEEKAWCGEAIRPYLKHAMWYSWTAPPGINGCIVSGLNYYDVFEDTPGGTRVAYCHNFGQEHPLFEPVPGRTYYVMAQSISDTSSARLTLSPVNILKARNDDFANAAPLLSTGLAANGDDYSRNRLTAEADEPLADPSQPDATRSAWWKWTAPSNGVFKIISPGYQYSDVSSGSVDNIYGRNFTVAAWYPATSMAGLGRVPGYRTAVHPTYFYGQSPSARQFSFLAVEGQDYLFQAASAEEFGGISVTILPGDAYDQWVFTHPGLDSENSGPDANPSLDGLPNLLKFGLGLDPTLPLLSDPRRDRAPVYTLSADGRTLFYTFWSDRFNTGNFIPFPPNGSPAFANTARIVAERSSDLVRWSPVTDAESLGDNRWRVTLPINGTQARRFVRLRAEWIPPLQPQ